MTSNRSERRLWSTDDEGTVVRLTLSERLREDAPMLADSYGRAGGVELLSGDHPDGRARGEHRLGIAVSEAVSPERKGGQSAALGTTKREARW